jgi:hypothetical protein
MHPRLDLRGLNPGQFERRAGVRPRHGQRKSDGVTEDGIMAGPSTKGTARIVLRRRASSPTLEKDDSDDVYENIVYVSTTISKITKTKTCATLPASSFKLQIRTLPSADYL